MGNHLKAEYNSMFATRLLDLVDAISVRIINAKTNY